MGEVDLWRGVLLMALSDAYANKSDGNIKDRKWHYGWSQTRDCQVICDYADIDWDALKDVFKRIYNNKERKPSRKELKKKLESLYKQDFLEAA
jgi:hypothetical protein